MNEINIGTDELKSMISNILGIDKVDTYLTIIEIFDSIGYNDYLYDIDSIVNVKDKVDSDPSTMVDNLTRTLKEHVVKYVKRYGIIIDTDKIYDPGLSFYGSLLLALTSIPAMDLSQAVYINNLINSDEVSDNTEILFNILQVFDPLLDLNMYYNIVDKIYDELLIRINNIAKDKLNQIDSDIEDYKIESLLNTIIGLIDLFVKNDSPITPSVILEYVNNPSNLLACINNNGCSKKYRFLLKEYLKTTDDIILDTPDLIEDTKLSLIDILSNLIITSLIEGDDLNNIIMDLTTYIDDISQKQLKDLYDKALDIVVNIFKDYDIEENINNLLKDYRKDENNG